MIEYRAVSLLDGAVVHFDREEWAQSAIDEGWIESYEECERAPAAVPGPAPEQLRNRAYAREADGFRDRALSYELEARAWREAGDELEAGKADARAKEALALYLAKKMEIRERHPDAGGEAVPAAPVPEKRPEAALPKYYLGKSGVYHTESCASRPAAAGELSLDEIREANPDARPCSRCGPPPLAGE